MCLWNSAVLMAICICAGLSMSAPPGVDPSFPEEGCERVEVTFQNGGSTLGGIAFIPEREGEVPGVVILGGSERGPITHMKRRLAGHFVGAGIAALVYDSPGFGRSTGNAMLQSRADRADEAIAAVRCLLEQERVRDDAVGIMGISEGALITMLAASRDNSVAFALPVSGAFGVPIGEAARYRIETKGELRGMEVEEIQRALLLEEILVGLLSDPTLVEWHLVEMKARRWASEPWRDLVETVRTMRDAESEAARGAMWDQLKLALVYWRYEAWFELSVVDLDRFDRLMSLSAGQFYMLLERGSLATGDFDKVRVEIEAYPKVLCPVLAVWGERDEFLPPRRSASFLKQRLREGGNEDVTLRIVEDASHILTKVEDPDRFCDGYPDMLSEWIAERFTSSVHNER